MNQLLESIFKNIDIAAVIKLIEEEQRAKANKDSNQQRVKVARKDKNLGKKFAVSQKSAATTKQDSTDGKEKDERITVINNRVFPKRKLHTIYEVNNKMLFTCNCNMSVMFPLDGSRIRVDKKATAEQ